MNPDPDNFLQFAALLLGVGAFVYLLTALDFQLPSTNIFYVDPLIGQYK